MKSKIALKNNISTDTVNEDICQFGNDAAPLVDNNGIHKIGGIINVQETETALPAGKSFFTDDGKRITASAFATDTIDVSIDGRSMGQLPEYGVEKKTEISSTYDDVALTVDDTYITAKLFSNAVTLSEYSRDNVLLHQRVITFTNLGSIAQYVTSFSIIKYNGMRYADSAEFAIRIGDQIVICQESSPGVSLGKYFQSWSVLGANNILCSVIYNNMLVVAGVGGRLGSYDGNAWRNYDGSGLGQGPASNAVAIGANDINCMIVYNGLLVVAGAGGRVASYDGVSWRNYDGSGGSSSVIYDNGTLIGTNAIKCAGVYKNTVVFAGVGGRVGCINQGNKYLYTNAMTSAMTNTLLMPITSNSLVCGANDINTIAYIPSDYANSEPLLLFGANTGKVGSYQGSWIYYDSTRGGTAYNTRTLPSYSLTPRKAIKAKGSAYCLLSSNVATAMLVSGSGRGWLSYNLPAPPASTGGYTSLAYGNGIFVIGLLTTSATDAVMTSTDGMNFTKRTTNIAPVTGFTDIVFNGTDFIAGCGSASEIYKSPDGINWTSITVPTGPIVWQYLAHNSQTNTTMALCGTKGTNATIVSTDGGNTWTAKITPATTAPWNSITAKNAGVEFVACCASGNTANSIMVYSAGSWALQTAPAPASWTTCTSNGQAVLVAGSGTTGMAIDNSGAFVSQIIPAPSGSLIVSCEFNNAMIFFSSTPSTSSGCITAAQISKNTIACNSGAAINNENITASITYNNNIAVFASAGGKVSNFKDGFTSYTGSGGVLPYNNSTVLGAVSINDIILSGSTLLFAGAASRIGSFDGTNWKNYDGTGTGTGQYTQSILGTQNINTIEYYGGLIIAGGVGGVVNSMSLSSVVSPFYNVSGLPVAQNILSGQISAGYLDAYRYENGLYLLGVVNNNLNKYYVLNNGTLDLVVLNGRYALVQNVGGKSRHIITETPRFDGSRMYFISLVGYTDFSTFSASQVYPADASILSSVLNSQIGWNYSDFTYKLTSSSTSIFNILAPVPAPQSATLYKTTQSNTNTLTTAYGKLNNASGAPSTKPFEFRLNWLNSGVSTVGAQQFISVASIDGGITDALGVIITDVGAFDDSYTPQIVNDDTILYKYQQKWYIIKISKVINNRLQRIASTLYKINTISPLNVIDSQFETLNIGSCDYQGRMIFNSGVVPAATNTKCVSVFTGKYSNSIDNGDRLVQIPSLSQNNIGLIGFRVPNTNRIIQNYNIDTFINDTYAFTTYNDASELVQADPNNPLYLPNDNLPIPIGGQYNNGAVTSPSLTTFLSPNYDGYAIGNDLPYAYTPFYLFGQNYLFDGLSIYLANIQNNVLTSTDRICDAYGMKFIAVTPSEAFLLSDFDNSVYSFNGGRTLVKSKAFTTLDIIDSGIWSTIDGTMLLNGTNSFIWVRDGIVTKLAKKATQTGLKFYSTQNGIIISNDAYSWQYTYYPQSGSLPIPLSFQTAYFGQDNNQLSIIHEWVVTIYNPRRDIIHITATEKGKDQDNQYSNQTQFILNSADYDSLGYAHIRVEPVYPQTLGASLIIQIAEAAAVLDISVDWEDAATAAIAANKSR